MELKMEETEDKLFPQQGFLTDFCSGENHLMLPPEHSFLAAQLQMHQEFDYQQIMYMGEEFQLGLPLDDMYLNTSEESSANELPVSAGAAGASQNEGRTSQDSQQSRRSSPFREWEGFSAAPATSSTTSCGKFAKKRMLVWIMNCLRLQHEEAAKKKIKLHHPSQQNQHQIQHPIIHQEMQQCIESPKKPSEKHMMAERNRRLKERELKDVLKSLLPSGAIKKKDKNSVYQYTIEYIKKLQDQNKELLEIVQTSKNEIDEEVNKSSASGSFSQTLNPVSSMLIHEDGSRMKLSFDTNGRKLQPGLWIDSMTCLRDMGFEVESIDWNPERSSILRITVCRLMPSAGFVSASQLCERLERKMFWEQ